MYSEKRCFSGKERSSRKDIANSFLAFVSSVHLFAVKSLLSCNVRICAEHLDQKCLYSNDLRMGGIQDGTCLAWSGIDDSAGTAELFDLSASLFGPKEQKKK